jgi:hypothetical protein
MKAKRGDRVGLFIAGVQKAGTTSLYSHLAAHRQLAAGEEKELHFFDDERIDWTTPDYDALHRRFPLSRNGRLRFDATPIYLFWPPALARIRRYNPDARFIVLVREPIARAHSAWAMEVRRGVERLSFSRAIRDGRDRLPLHERTAPAWREFSYVERGFYGQQVASALALFPRERFLFLRSADLHDDHRRVLRDVSDFLGLDPFPECDARYDHRRPLDQAVEPMAPDDHAYLRALYHRDTTQFAALANVRVNDWPSASSD